MHRKYENLLYSNAHRNSTVQAIEVNFSFLNWQFNVLSDSANQLLIFENSKLTKCPHGSPLCPGVAKMGTSMLGR